MEDLSAGVPTDLSQKFRVPAQQIDANSPIFSKNIRQKETGTMYIELALTPQSQNAVLYVVRDGLRYALNSGNQLVAGNAYGFLLVYQGDEQLNFEFAFTGPAYLGYFRILYRRWL